MPYIITKTNGTLLATIQDGTVDNSTSLTFIGKNFSGYGSPIEENFVGLLENFNNSTAPTKPIQGQLWFNQTTKQMNVCYDGKNFKGIGSITVGSTSSVANPVTGDLFWTGGSLYGYDTVNGYTLVGPVAGSNYSSWKFGRELSNTITQNAYFPAILGIVGNKPMVTFSNAQYFPDASTDIGVNSLNTFTMVQAGLTLPGVISGQPPVPGSNTISAPGSSINSGYYFWGTSAESLASVAVELTNSSANINGFVPFTTNNAATGVQTLSTSPNFYFNPSTNVLNVTATSAYYADLAERYEADETYEVGTVLVLGGSKEVTTTTKYGDVRVAGIVSEKPAYLMNKDAGTDATHPAIALKGRVPCKVYGNISKGDLLVTSAHAGYAEAYTYENNPNAVIAKAIGTNSDGFGVIEVLVV